jgi:hypothetical protein
MARSVDELTDLELALVVLQDGGASREEALSVVAFDGTITERLAPAIQSKRAELAERVAQIERQAFAATPEGAKAAVREALARKAERDELVAGSKVLLQEQGLDTDGLTDAEVLHISGVEKSPELMRQRERDEAHEALAARWRSLDPMEQARQATELGISGESIERYVRVMEGDDTPTVTAWGETAGIDGGEGADDGGEGQ